MVSSSRCHTAAKAASVQGMRHGNSQVRGGNEAGCSEGNEAPQDAGQCSEKPQISCLQADATLSKAHHPLKPFPPSVKALSLQTRAFPISPSTALPAF